MSNLVNKILSSCETHKDLIAIEGGQYKITYRELALEIYKWKKKFQSQKNCIRIGFSLVNCPHYISALYGAIAAGAKPFLIDTGLPDMSKDLLARSLGLDLIIKSKTGSLAWFKNGINSDPDFEFMFLENATSTFTIDEKTIVCRFTSGTNGIPKCLEFSDNSVLSAADTWARAQRYSTKDKILCLAAFFNGLAFNTSFSSVFLSGATLLLYPGMLAAPMVFRYAIKTFATRLVAFPAFYEQAAKLNSVSLSSSSISFAYSAASRLSQETRKEFKRVHGIHIADYYGLAEAGPVTYEPSEVASVGTGMPLPGCEIKVKDGILLVKTPYHATSYLNFPGVLEKCLDADGYLLTADFAEIVEGRLFIGERSDGILNVAGKKFNPSDTRGALLSITGIKEACVVGLALGNGTHEVCAAISCSADLQEAEIRRMLAQKIEAYKIPSQIYVVASIPRNGAGKPYTSEIKKLFKQ